MADILMGIGIIDFLAFIAISILAFKQISINKKNNHEQRN